MATCYKCDRCENIQNKRLTKLTILPATNISEDDQDYYNKRRNAANISKHELELCENCVATFNRYYRSLKMSLKGSEPIPGVPATSNEKVKYTNQPEMMLLPSLTESRKEPRIKDALLAEAIHTLHESSVGRHLEKSKAINALATLNAYGFGVIVHRRVRPNCVQMFDKRFGSRPLTRPEVIDIGMLYRIQGGF